MIEEKMNRDHSSIIFLCSCNVGMPHWVYPLRPSVSHKSKTGPTFSQICFLVKTKDCIFLSHRNRFWMDLPSFLALCSNQTPMAGCVSLFLQTTFTCVPYSKIRGLNRFLKNRRKRLRVSYMTLFCFLLLPQRKDCSQLRAMIYAWHASSSLCMGCCFFFAIHARVNGGEKSLRQTFFLNRE